MVDSVINFRDLTADDIEVRIQSVKQNGIVLLLYKNARVDMNILDETVGAANWQREHYECKGNLFCRVGIRIGDAWVWKSDCGTESNTEAQKGEASDSFKRACFNWGIGRELYTSPFIWVKDIDCNINSGKCYDKFAVKKIKIENKKITGLVIQNVNKQAICFSWEEKKISPPQTSSVPAVYKCADCGIKINDLHLPNGEVVTAKNVYERSNKTYGLGLCYNCAQKRKNNAK